MTRQQLKERIIATMKFGADATIAAMEAEGQICLNYDIRILTIFCEEDPIFSLRYELQGSKFKMWAANSIGDKNGIRAIPQYDTFEENLESVCDTIDKILEALGDYADIKWLGD